MIACLYQTGALPKKLAASACGMDICISKNSLLDITIIESTVEQIVTKNIPKILALIDKWVKIMYFLRIDC